MKNPLAPIMLLIGRLLIALVFIIAAPANSIVADERARAPAVAAASASPISLEQTFYLIRSSLLTLNDANHSGNYTVLRDLAAPDFQARNSAADLAQAFSDLRRRKFDLFGAALLAPQLTAAPKRDEKGMLRLVGSFPTRPLQISFDLMFQAIGGQWRLYGISVATPAAVVAQAAPEAVGRRQR